MHRAGKRVFGAAVNTASDQLECAIADQASDPWRGWWRFFGKRHTAARDKHGHQYPGEHRTGQLCANARSRGTRCRVTDKRAARNLSANIFSPTGDVTRKSEHARKLI
jgi:hypothetical protein